MNQPVKREPCIGKDPYCPCRDGDLCNYRGPSAFSIEADVMDEEETLP